MIDAESELGLRVVAADESEIKIAGRRHSYFIIPSIESVSLWVERAEGESTFLISVSNDREGWKSLIAKINEFEARGFSFNPV